MGKIINNKPLLLILVAGFILKLLYLFVVGPAVFQNWTLTTPDSHSYTNTFINLVNTGDYTHDHQFIDASYGRLPVVVFAWGIFYLVLGEAKAFIGLAVFQIILDVLATYLVYKIFLKLFSDRTALIVGLVYALFPLTFYFIVKTDTEYLSLFLIILVLHQLIYFKPDLRNCLMLGFLLILGFYIREILLILIPLSVFYLWRNHKLSFSKYVSMFLFMLVLYLPWPLRNYMKSERLILIKPLSAGYADYQRDMLGYMYWLYAWHNDQPDDYLAYAYHLEREIVFPDEVFASEAEKQLAVNTVKLARKCGTSFISWQREAGVKEKCYGCYDRLIARSFKLLKKSYKTNHPFNYYFKIPFQNLKKALFKTSLTYRNMAPEIPFKIFMAIRCLLIFIGLFACFSFWKEDYFKITLIFFCAIYFLVTALLRQVEMRYLFQVDVLILLAATAFLAEKFFKKKAV